MVKEQAKKHKNNSKRQENQEETEGRKPETPCAAREVIGNTIRIARLKLLFIAAKITGHSSTYEVKYFIIWQLKYEGDPYLSLYCKNPSRCRMIYPPRYRFYMRLLP